MNGISDFLKEIIAAYQDGPSLVKRLVVIGAVLAIAGAIALGIGDAYNAILFGVYIYRQSIQQAVKEKKYREVELRVKENPKETQAAWELARVKLESYLDRNLRQVRAIFWLTAFVNVSRVHANWFRCLYSYRYT